MTMNEFKKDERGSGKDRLERRRGQRVAVDNENTFPTCKRACDNLMRHQSTLIIFFDAFPADSSYQVEIGPAHPATYFQSFYLVT